MKLLLNVKSVDLNARAKDGRTPLITACLTGGASAEAVVKPLVNAGCLPNCSDQMGDVALHHVPPGSLQTFLVSKGARTKIANNARRKCVDDAQAAVLKPTAKAFEKAPPVPSDKSSIDEKHASWMPDAAR